MNTQRSLIAITFITSIALGGCAGMSSRETSTVTGAAVGAVAGSVVGGPAATVGGAVIGGVVGTSFVFVASLCLSLLRSGYKLRS